MKKRIMISLCVCLAVISCDVYDSDDSSEESTDNFSDDDAIEAVGYPMDATLKQDGSLVVLYSLYESGTEGASSSLIWFDDAQKPVKTIDLSLDFPHTLDLYGQDVLISDSNNNRLVIYSEDSGNVEEINFEGWENDTVWPNDADFTSDGNIIFSDLFNATINKITPDGELIWTRFPYTHSGELSNPGTDELHDPDELSNGNLIYCLSKSGQIVEIDENNDVVWYYNEDLFWPKSVQRLDPGSTLITDLNHIIEIDEQGDVIWEYISPSSGCMNAERLDGGNTLTGTNNVALIAPDGTILWELDPAYNHKSMISDKPDHRLMLLKSIGYLNG